MLKKILVLATVVGLFLNVAVIPTKAAELTPRQELLKQLPNDTVELVSAGENTVAIWSVTTSSGEPLEMTEAILISESGIIKTTVWTIGPNLKSMLVITNTGERDIPMLTANLENGRIEAVWQIRPFSEDDLDDMRKYAEEVVRVVLHNLGIESESGLKKYVEKDRI